MSVLTQHNNNLRTGVKTDELTLTINAVQTDFRKLFEVRVDPPEAGGPVNWASQIVAQPLFVSDLPWSNGTTKDVLIVCTMHGTVYAFDAGNKCSSLWANWLGPAVQDFGGADPSIGDQKDLFKTNPEWGILSTPVIDPDLKRVYVVMWHNENGGTYRLHKLNLMDGNEIGQPAIINGAKTNAAGQVVNFNPIFQKQRPGLLLLKRTDLPQSEQTKVGVEGTIYIAFGASIESDPNYHGWVFAYDASTLNQQAVWCSTLNGSQGGVWQAGGGLAADQDGNIYLMTGNGDFDATQQNFGESFVKLSCDTLQVLSSFTPWNWQDLNTDDRDLGSSGPVCIADTNYLIGAGKTGVLYSLDRNNLGGVGNDVTQKNPDVSEVQATGDPPHPNPDHDHHVHGTPVYFETLSRIYLWGENDVLKAFTINPTRGQLSRGPVQTGTTVAPNGMPGAMLSLSANGNANAILWALMPLQSGNNNEDANTRRLVDGVLRAFDAQSLQEIWNSSTNNADQLGHFAKFAPPTIAKGRVYAATYDGKFVVYGLG
jgi:outer membrane protein assembly factor BamB